MPEKNQKNLSRGCDLQSRDGGDLLLLAADDLEPVGDRLPQEGDLLPGGDLLIPAGDLSRHASSLGADLPRPSVVALFWISIFLCRAFFMCWVPLQWARRLTTLFSSHSHTRHEKKDCSVVCLFFLP